MEQKRIIKFRVWDKAAKRMSPEFHLFGEFTMMGGVHSWQEESGIKGDSLERLNDLVELQFTGLHDKNGKEIYDKDIIKDQGGNLLTVFWNNDSGEWSMDHPEGLHSLTNSVSSWGEIIGSVYSTPNLLEK